MLDQGFISWMKINLCRIWYHSEDFMERNKFPVDHMSWKCLESGQKVSPIRVTKLNYDLVKILVWLSNVDHDETSISPLRNFMLKQKKFMLLVPLERGHNILQFSCWSLEEIQLASWRKLTMKIESWSCLILRKILSILAISTTLRSQLWHFITFNSHELLIQFFHIIEVCNVIFKYIHWAWKVVAWIDHKVATKSCTW